MSMRVGAAPVGRVVEGGISQAAVTAAVRVVARSFARAPVTAPVGRAVEGGLAQAPVRAPAGDVVAVGACAGGSCNAAEHEARTAKLSDAGPPQTMSPPGAHPEVAT
jgi:hypothetical protein